MCTDDMKKFVRSIREMDPDHESYWLFNNPNLSPEALQAEAEARSKSVYFSFEYKEIAFTSIITFRTRIEGEDAVNFILDGHGNLLSITNAGYQHPHSGSYVAYLIQKLLKENEALERSLEDERPAKRTKRADPPTDLTTQGVEPNPGPPPTEKELQLQAEINRIRAEMGQQPLNLLGSSSSPAPTPSPAPSPSYTPPVPAVVIDVMTKELERRKKEVRELQERSDRRQEEERIRAEQRERQQQEELLRFYRDSQVSQLSRNARELINQQLEGVPNNPTPSPTPKKKEQQPAKDEADACPICCYAEKDAVLLPCKHQCVCSECAVKVDQCPICRTPIKEKLLNIFKS